MAVKLKPFICSAETVFDGQWRGMYTDGMYTDITAAACDFAMRFARYVPLGTQLNVQYANPKDDPGPEVTPHTAPPRPIACWPPIRDGHEMRFGVPFSLPELRILMARMDKGIPTTNGECCRCHRRFDLFWYVGRIYCGDCRHYMRHGTWPVYDRRPTSYCREARPPREHQYGSETLHRFRRTRVPSVKYAKMLLDIEQACRAD